MNPFKGNLIKYAYFTGLSIVAALGNMGVVYTINRIIKEYFANDAILPTIYLYYFAGSLVLFITSRWLVSMGLIGLTQKLLLKTRTELLGMILKSSFSALSRNKNRIYTALTRDTDNIVGASMNMVDIFTNFLIILICLVYMATLSWKLMLCMTLLVAFTIAVYMYSIKRTQRLIRLAMANNDTFVKYLGEVLAGFKEITMERRKGYDIEHKHISRAINQAGELNQKAMVNNLNNRIIGQIAFYVFIGLVMLVLGDLFGVERSVTVSFIFLVLYIWGPIETVVLLIPNLTNARISIKRIDALEGEMRKIETI